MYRRIRRPKDQEVYYMNLTNKSEFGIFATYKDVFMAAGMVGFMEKKRRRFSQTLEGIQWNVFNLETDEVVINAVALSESNSLELLNTDEKSFDEKMLIFEEYAAGGLDILYKRIMEDPKNALNVYIEFIMSLEAETTAQQRNLKDIADILTF